jgi:diadenosine tetraphosphate (Ap4A) HIT family hydrolase
MSVTIIERIDAARAGTNPALICRVPSGWVVLCDMQFLRGYCILLHDPVVTSLNELNPILRAEYLCDMALVGDALMEVTGAYRINYAIAGNTDPYLHAHIVPRYMTEPESIRKGLPWSYPKSTIDATMFDIERDQGLIQQLKQSLLKRL